MSCSTQAAQARVKCRVFASHAGRPVGVGCRPCQRRQRLACLACALPPDRLNSFAAMRLTRLLAPSMAEKGGQALRCLPPSSPGRPACLGNAQRPQRCPLLRAADRAAVLLLSAGAGHIVSLGSVAGLKGVADEGSYAATKWALRSWSTACYEVGSGLAAKLEEDAGRQACECTRCLHRAGPLSADEPCLLVLLCAVPAETDSMQLCSAGPEGARHQGDAHRAGACRHRHGYGAGAQEGRPIP